MVTIAPGREEVNGCVQVVSQQMLGLIILHGGIGLSIGAQGILGSWWKKALESPPTWQPEGEFRAQGVWDRWKSILERSLGHKGWKKLLQKGDVQEHP